MLCVKWMILLGISIFPPILAFLIDGWELKSYVHVPIVGTIGIVATLCDALFGQIAAITKDIPFKSGGTPALVESYARSFTPFNRKIFSAWVVTKFASGISIVMSGVVLASDGENLLDITRTILLYIGYIALGVVLASSYYFFNTYVDSSEALLELKLRLLSKEYSEKHPPRNQIQLKKFKDQLHKEYDKYSPRDVMSTVDTIDDE